MNNAVVYDELKSIYSDLSPEQAAALAEPISESITRIFAICLVARKQGLLALENCAEGEGNPFLKKLLYLIVDGTGAGLVEMIGTAEYFSKYMKESPLVRLTALIDLCGALDIQAGENPHVIEVKLSSMAPKGIEDCLKGKTSVG